MTVLLLRHLAQPQNERLPGTMRIKHEQIKVSFTLRKFKIFVLHVVLLGQRVSIHGIKCMPYFGWVYEKEPNVDMKIILKLPLKYL